MDDDRLDPRFASAVRAALLDEVRAAPAARASRPTRAARRRPRWQPVLALGIAAVTIVAIAVGFSVASQTRSSPPATQPFNGVCAEILTSNAASALIGKPLHLLPAAAALRTPETVAVPAIGGLHCAWSGDGDAQDESGITLTVLPAGLRPKHVKAETGCFGQNEGKQLQYTCNLDLVTGGHWITGQVTGLELGTQARTESDTARLRTILRTLPAEPKSGPVDRTGWWAPIECAALGKRADLGTALQHPDLQTLPGNGDMVTAGQGVALSRTVAANCILQAGADIDPLGGEIHAFGGAARFVEQQLDGSDVRRLANVHGAEVYLLTDSTAGTSALWVLDRGNALELLTGAGSARPLLPAVEPLLTVLHGHVR